MKTTKINKRLESLNMSDVSIVADASGSRGTVYHPHFRCNVNSDSLRFEVLKIKTTFTKVILHLNKVFC